MPVTSVARKALRDAKSQARFVEGVRASCVAPKPHSAVSGVPAHLEMAEQKTMTRMEEVYDMCAFHLLTVRCVEYIMTLGTRSTKQNPIARCTSCRNVQRAFGEASPRSAAHLARATWSGTTSISPTSNTVGGDVQTMSAMHSQQSCDKDQA